MTAEAQPTIGEFKERQRAIWSAGDYPLLSDLISDVGETVVARAGVEPGMRVLDVAYGTGNAARPAARRGAAVTGLDLTPELLEAGRTKAEAEGLEIEWVEGDAEELPFAEGSFDRVVSTFGHMFAPRHQRAADELARVCRPGGAIAICCWTPAGVVGDLFRATAEYLPPPPEFAQPPILWGAEEHVRDLFPQAEGFEFERHVTRIEWESPAAWTDYFSERFGPLVTASALLGDRFAELRGKLTAIFAERNEASDGTLHLPQEYLLSVIRV